MRHTILAVAATLLAVTTAQAQDLYDISTIRTIEIAAGFNLVGAQQPKVASPVDYVVTKAPASASGGLFAGAAGSLNVPGLGALLLNPLLLLPVATYQADATGASKVSLGIPNISSLRGRTVYLQSVVASGGQILLSNGVGTFICK